MKKISRHAAVTVVTLCCICLPSSGEKVFLNNGKTVTGTVTKKDDKVIVKTRDGRELSYPQKQVLYIAPDKPLESPAGLDNEISDGGSEDEGFAEELLEPTAPVIPESSVTLPGSENIKTKHLDASSLIKRPRFSLLKCTAPEAALYTLLRRRTGEIDPDSATERYIAKYREYTHDKKRRYGERWYSEKTFIKSRDRFRELAAQAEDHYEKAKKARECYKELSKTGVENLDREQQREMLEYRKAMLKHAQEASKYFKKAPMAVLDDLLRHFLIGVGSHTTGEYTEAFKNFEYCRKRAPYIRCFRQGYAMALMSLERYEDAIDEYVQIVEMSTEFKESLSMLATAMSKAPGKIINKDSFKKARELLKSFQGTRSSRYISESRERKNKENWLFPGNVESCDEGSLPDLPMDRLVIRRGVAVPISSSTLLVAPEVLKDAEEVMIFDGNNTLIGVEPDIDDSGRGPEKVSAGLLTSSRYEFKPLEIAVFATTRGKGYRIFGVNIMAEMPNRTRLMPFTIKNQPVDGAGHLPPNVLMPGEAGSPVLTPDGKLAGLASCPTDPIADKFPCRFLSVTDLKNVLEKAEKSRSRSSRRSRGIDKISLSQQSFMVFAVSCERFGKRR